MATSFDEIIDLGLSTIQDYKLNNLYQDNPESFQIITSTWLTTALAEFTLCKTPLTYNLESRTFNNDLSSLEVSILADLWVYEWFTFHINKVTQFENSMTPSDYSHHSKAENLKQKSEFLDKIRERFSQKMQEYDLQTFDWSNY